jgi:hypothetical protein
MIKKTVMAVLKFFLVDSLVNVLGHLFEQVPPMWLFIGWGWASMLVIMASLISTLAA